MAWSVFSKLYFDTNGKGGVGMVVALVDIVMFSVNSGFVLVYVDIMRNKVFVGLLYWFAINRITESQWM